MLNNPNYEISGKTGTARRAYGGKQGYEKNGMRRYQATFCGFFPSSDPIYTAIVILYSGDTPGNFYGASQAGPVFKQIADFIYANSPEWNKVLDGKFVAQSGRHPSIAKGRASASKIAVESLPMANKNVLLGKLEAHKWVNFKADSSSVFPVRTAAVRIRSPRFRFFSSGKAGQTSPPRLPPGSREAQRTEKLRMLLP